MVKTSLTNLAKRLPMIRFRYGIGRESAKNISTSESYAHPTTAGSSGPAIEDWQLPARYQRKPIDKYECEIINRGGRE
ncbi:uncharacterized protein LOC119071342 isoform X2 [Bradysia coprophila]|uniref:uncharacterized protein LOC119071342 isoform X2 n=1 Tax=Bradysia coprophila TaxID=38358 RepID=UPI00187DA850|nr:uncharacterized protein LOC119071342 isoform X2 [Bradysia coprophila]